MLYLNGGTYHEDRFCIWSMGRLSQLKNLPEEYRTEQDRQQINDLQEAFRARREAEGNDERSA